MAIACLLAFEAPGSTVSQKPQDDRAQPIRVGVHLVTTDVIVRSSRGQFVSDLKQKDFEVYEDGVRQQVVLFSLTHGGRTFTAAAPPERPTEEGIILPAVRPALDASGRVFLIFFDDLHLSFRDTTRARHLFTLLSKELIHDGDLFGLVSTGPSSLAIDLTYDRKRLQQAVDKISGAGLTPGEVVETPTGSQGPSEVRHRAHVAFSTAYDILRELEQIHDRRKVMLYVSGGYDFNPFPEARAKAEAARFGGTHPDGVNPFLKQGTQFSEADLIAELAELTRAANRANTTIYTIDPRGLVAGADLDQPIGIVEWQDHVRRSQDALRVIADETGGMSVVNSNDFTRALKRIDAETSDYYVIGFYSSNPDPKQRRRTLEVKVGRPNVRVQHRTEYSLPPPAR